MAQFYDPTDSKMASSVRMDSEAFEYTDLPPEKQGTAIDRRDMHRMGKAQEFKVRAPYGASSASSR